MDPARFSATLVTSIVGALPLSAEPVSEGATLVTLTASSEQSDNGNFIANAADGNPDTRWCASGPAMPQWLQVTFDEPTVVTGVKLVWEREEPEQYRYKIEGTVDGDEWKVLVDESGGGAGFGTEPLKALHLTCTGSAKGGWASIREVRVEGPQLKAIRPKPGPIDESTLPRPVSSYDQGGNVPPRIVSLSADEEAEILKDVEVPEGFDLTLFAPSQAANYPVYVAASPEGDLYVSSDGNGSSGRKPHRGRVLRLRDTDQDGRADQVTTFVKDVDSPRGLIWDHDRLYLLHPPDISVYFDRDGDGVAEESKVLVRDIAFGFKDRPADHTTNGLELGIDGWIYIAGGDFGFLKATGSDGRTLQHRGGGVIRFRPDGSGLELFATGTRNILGTPMSPTLDLFARDNTNDGGGWDVRFHHFTGLEDHGYPRLYMNFADETVAPLGDYGGGSGCGSVYLHEPGFPGAWADAPFTCDWGRDGLFHHRVEPKGATFAETTGPTRFIKLTRPTDADVDGLSRVYQASWKGATFDWVGPDCGYIVRVTPKDYAPEPLPDFDTLEDAALVAQLESPSHVRTLAAQRALLRRPRRAETEALLAKGAADPAKDLGARVAMLYTLRLRDPETFSQSVFHFGSAPSLEPFVLRALGDPPDLDRARDAGLFIAGTRARNPRTRLEACVAAARRGMQEVAPAMAALLGDDDPVVAHTAWQALARLGAYEAVLSVLDDPSESRRTAAARALMRMHRPEVVDALLARLDRETRPEFRRPILSALCRLHHTEAEWKGESWGTRPDTRGPYYQPVTWPESERILGALKEAVNRGSAEEATFLVREMNRNRIQSNEALDRIVKLAASDARLVPDAVSQLAAAGHFPPEALPLVLQAARETEIPAAARVAAIQLLMEIDSPDAVPAAIDALVLLDDDKVPGNQRNAGRHAFLNAPKLENHHHDLAELAAKHGDGSEGFWAHAALLTLASRDPGGPEAREAARRAIDAAWARTPQRLALIRAAARLGNHFLDDRIRVSRHDADAAVAKAAGEAAGKLGLQAESEDATPKIANLAPDDALKQVVETDGDVALGEAVFQRASCVTCHTTRQDQVQKGPYLGNIAGIYRRPDLAEAILDPNKTIAQGFTSNVITCKDGKVLVGFVTQEAGDQLTLRDIAAQEHTIAKAEIATRDTLPTSMMPPGLMNTFSVHEVASLLSYLEALAKE